MNYTYYNKNLDSIDTIQNVALDIYGKYDLEKSMLWMTEEYGEFFKAIRKKECKENIVEEMGDLLAWIFCMANILDINISDAIKSTFNKEISRQLETYSKMKYCSRLEGLNIIE